MQRFLNKRKDKRMVIEVSSLVVTVAYAGANSADIMAKYAAKSVQHGTFHFEIGNAPHLSGSIVPAEILEIVKHMGHSDTRTDTATLRAVKAA